MSFGSPSPLKASERARTLNLSPGFSSVLITRGNGNEIGHAREKYFAAALFRAKIPRLNRRSFIMDTAAPPPPSPRDVTHILQEWSGGDRDAANRLMPLVYAELRRLARNYLNRERSDHTLQPTALVHEAYLRLVDQKRTTWQNRAHFYAIAAQMMRRVLIDHARAHGAQKHGGLAHKLSLDEARFAPDERPADLLALDEALNVLAKIDKRKSKVVELRFFGGLSLEETAEVLEVSEKTVRRDWEMAKLWLHRELSEKAAGKV
jgi:RNA polymerase sigma factor (TIGR02999 family)